MEAIDRFFDYIFGWMPMWLVFIVFGGLVMWGIEHHIRSMIREELSDLESRVSELEDKTEPDYDPEYDMP